MSLYCIVINVLWNVSLSGPVNPVIYAVILFMRIMRVVVRVHK